MAVRDIFKISRKTFFNPTAWIDLDTLLAFNHNIWSVLRALFQKPTIEAASVSFEEAMRQQGVDPSQLDQIAINYQTYGYVFFLLGVCAVVFSGYLLFFHATFSGLLLALSAAALLFSQWFRYSFWHFQIKTRSLRCTPQEWWQGRLSHKDAP